MNFATVKNGEIVSFINNYKEENSGVLPLSTLRALSFHHNPRASENDVVLVLAYKKNVLVGFIGFLPDYIKNDSSKKFAWNSGWWIDSNKGKDIAIPLLLYGLKLWNNQVGFIDLPQHSYEILKVLGIIDDFGDDFGVKFILRPYLPQRFRLSWLEGVLKFLPKFSRVTTATESEEAIFGLSDELSWEMESFIAFNQSSTFQRGKNEFDWIMQYPWLSGNKKYIKEQNIYPFSLQTVSYQLKCFHIKINSYLIAVGFLKERDGHYSLPYLYYNKNHIRLILSLVINHINQEKGKSFFICQSYLKQIISDEVLKMVPQSKVYQKTAFTKAFVSKFGRDIQWQDGDGDVIFT